MKLDAMTLICVQLVYLCPDIKVTLVPKKELMVYEIHRRELLNMKSTYYYI